VIYYGTEQGFDERRASMFAGGVGSGGRDHFDTDAPLYRYLHDAIALRRDHELFSRGSPTVLASNAARAAAIPRPTHHGVDAAITVLNTADSKALLDNIDTGLPAGTVLQPLFGIEGMPDAQVAGADGRLTLVLPPRSGQIWRVGAATAPSPTADVDAAPAIDPFANRVTGTL